MTIYLETENKLLVLQSDAGPAGRFESVRPNGTLKNTKLRVHMLMFNWYLGNFGQEISIAFVFALHVHPLCAKVMSIDIFFYFPL